jgi:hypothetical protein
MSLPLAIAAIVFADLALITLLIFVMSRAKRLAPHVPVAGAAERAPRHAGWRARSAPHSAPAGTEALSARA